MDSMEHRINWWWLGILWSFRYCFSRTMWWRLFIECLLCAYIYVALTVFRHSYHGCCKPFCRVDCVIPCVWFCDHKNVYTSRMSLHSRTRTPTQLAMYCVFQIHYSDVWWWIIRVKPCPLYYILDAETFQYTFVLLNLDTIFFSDRHNYMDF